ncbi:sensor histidine kinase [Loktanella sp. M215]|uniref:sensor histidine kinase n=1 Tax=Loktanella sp. M215 TaxID=2675431 RepID=UPI001F47E36E|nr:hypothetical protein [Loktanella sp. M215]
MAGADRARDAIALVPGWTAITLSNQVTGETLFQETATGFVAGVVTEPPSTDASDEAAAGQVIRAGQFCPCVVMEVPVPGKPSLSLIVYVDPQVYQDRLMEQLPDDAVGAIVDRNGNFIARSLDFVERVGTPGTSYVLQAVAAAGTGIYQGVTFEGLTNYSAYATSALTGWSAHVAVNKALIDQPRSRGVSALIVGALTAILIGAGLPTYVIKDLDTRRAEDRRMMELQRSEAMSQFTATIVHDFRNILSAMQSGLRMIVRKTDNLEIVQYARLIEGAVERGTKLSNRLLSFAKEDGAEIAPVGLRELCDDMAYLLQQAAGPQVEVDVQISEGSLTAQVNRDQLELALVNLVVNARDAMHGSGRIVIAASQRGSDIEISVTDTGPGIPAELRSDLFKPFFTTKAGNGGTGLGLAQVAGMASQAKGAVSIEDAPGGGAEFLIRLPCAEADSTVSAKFT